MGISHLHKIRNVHTALHTQIITMKVALALCALVAVTLAQRPPAGNHNNHNQHGLGGLIHHEVVALLAADSALTEDMCATKCDALFDLVDGADETQTDTLCKTVCTCEIQKNCPHHQQHQQHTRPTAASGTDGAPSVCSCRRSTKSCTCCLQRRSCCAQFGFSQSRCPGHPCLRARPWSSGLGH